MNEPTQNVPTTPQRDINWMRRIIMIAVGVAAVVLAYIVGGQVIPREWAQFVGGQVDQSIARGVSVGLFYGIVCTLLPLLVLYFGFRRRRSMKVWLAYLVGALVLATPNLLTLGIVIGDGNAAHAGERILDTEASYFRGATLVGVLIGVALFVFIASVLIRRHRLKDQREDIDRERAALERAREELGGKADGP